MQAEVIFNICNAIAMIGWLLLLLASPLVWKIDRFIMGIPITLLAIVYTWLIATSFDPGAMKEFSSLEGVMGLFTNKTMVTAGWVHYLAFDLLVGTWIKKNAVLHGIGHGWIIPCLLLTFMLGPVGLLLYLLIRVIKTKKYFGTNFD